MSARQARNAGAALDRRRVATIRALRSGALATRRGASRAVSFSLRGAERAGRKAEPALAAASQWAKRTWSFFFVKDTGSEALAFVATTSRPAVRAAARAAYRLVAACRRGSLATVHVVRASGSATLHTARRAAGATAFVTVQIARHAALTLRAAKWTQARLREIPVRQILARSANLAARARSRIVLLSQATAEAAVRRYPYIKSEASLLASGLIRRARSFLLAARSRADRFY
jgi:hypothetical protein